MRDTILSSLQNAPTSRFIYSSLSFYGPHHNEELPGSWFTRALTTLGVDEMAIRQTLYRMEREGALVSRKEGRTKVYSATPSTRAVIDAGSAKMRPPVEEKWDGTWTLVRFLLDGGMRQIRDRLREVLQVEGFASLGSGLYIHPRDRSSRLAGAVKALNVAGRVHIFRGPRLHGVSERSFVRELWDVDAIAVRYREFVAAFDGLAGRNRWDPREAAAVRFALVFRFLEVAWDDPELPPDLLPARWPGRRAREVVRRLYDELTPPALEFGNAIMDESR